MNKAEQRIAELEQEQRVNLLKHENQQLRAQCAAMREVLELCDPNGERLGISAEEDEEVLELCKLYGFGAIMDSVARQWRKKDQDGAFIVGPCVATIKKALSTTAGRDLLERLRELQNDRNLEKRMRKDAEDRCTELEERVRKLDLVAELAQKFLSAIDLAQRTGAPLTMPPVQWEALYKLRDAIADLERGETISTITEPGMMRIMTEKMCTELEERVRKLERLIAPAKNAAKWMEWWLEDEVCDCEDGNHICGLPARRRELRWLQQVLADLEKIYVITEPEVIIIDNPDEGVPE